MKDELNKKRIEKALDECKVNCPRLQKTLERVVPILETYSLNQSLKEARQEKQDENGVN